MRQIRLSKGLFALVDEADFEKVNQYKWSASFESRGTKYYAVRKERVRVCDHVDSRKITKKIRMHRFIIGIDDTDKRVVDHINHNSLDNRKANLEIVDQRTNMLRSPRWKRKGVKNGPNKIEVD